MQPLLTIKDVADILKLKLDTVRRHKAKGLLPPHVVVFGSHRWEPEVIADWVKAGCPASRTLANCTKGRSKK